MRPLSARWPTCALDDLCRGCRWVLAERCTVGGPEKFRNEPLARRTSSLVKTRSGNGLLIHFVIFGSNKDCNLAIKPRITMVRTLSCCAFGAPNAQSQPGFLPYGNATMWHAMATPKFGDWPRNCGGRPERAGQHCLAACHGKNPKAICMAYCGWLLLAQKV